MNTRHIWICISCSMLSILYIQEIPFLIDIYFEQNALRQLYISRNKLSCQREEDDFRVRVFSHFPRQKPHFVPFMRRVSTRVPL